MPDTAAHTENGRITLALLGQKLDRVSSDLQEFISETRKHREAVEDRLRNIERTQAIEKERLNASKEEEKCLRADVEQVQDDLDDLALKSNWWNGLNTALAAVGSLIAGILGTRQ